MDLLSFIGIVMKEAFKYESEDLKQSLLRPSVLVIILVNLIPIFGAIFLAWSLLEILLLYWSESAAIGFYMLLKLSVLMWNQKNPDKDKPEPGLFSKLFGIFLVVDFFIIHFGGFMFGHLFFILAIFGPPDADLAALFSPILYGTLAFFVSHGVSFMNNFIVEKEYKKTDMGKITITSYTRIGIMQFAIILGLILTFWMIPLGIPPVGPMLIIIAAKTLSDVAGHLREHKIG